MFVFIMSLYSFTCLLCDQSVALEIRHSRRYCGVCQQSTWHSATDKILIKTHKNEYTQRTQLRV